MTATYAAWATTSLNNTGDPGIGITQHDSEIDNPELVTTSKPQADDWAITNTSYGDRFDDNAADELLEQMGWRRRGDWSDAGTSYVCGVERSATP